jgi:hypothetical protein
MLTAQSQTIIGGSTMQSLAQPIPGQSYSNLVAARIFQSTGVKMADHFTLADIERLGIEYGIHPWLWFSGHTFVGSA